MGKYDALLGSLRSTAMRGGVPVPVVAAAAELEPLRAVLEAEPGAAFNLVAAGPSEAVPDQLFAAVPMAVIEVDPEDRGSLRRVTDIRRRHPHLAVVAAIKGGSVAMVRTLVREGISDVVALPFDLSELLQVSMDVLANREADAQVATVLAPMVAVARSIGGCGATSIATHLAADLAEADQSGRGVVIVDLDLQFGSVADYLGVRPKGNVADLLGAPERLDRELITSVLDRTANGVSVIGAPDTIMPLESVETEDLLRLLQLLREQFAYVVLDLPANWTNWTLSAALQADMLLLVVELSVPSLRHAKRRLDLFRSVGIEADHVKIVVNRVEKRLFRTIGLDDVAATLGHAVESSIALEAPVVSAAQNEGQLVGSLKRKSKFVQDVAQLGAALRSQLQKAG